MSHEPNTSTRLCARESNSSKAIASNASVALCTVAGFSA